MVSKARFSPEWNAVKLIFNEPILIWWIRFWVVHRALVMGYNIGAVTIFIHRLWTKLWQAKPDFLQSEMQLNWYSMNLSWSDQSDVGYFTKPWSRATILVLLPSLYVDFEPSYGKQSQIFSRVKCRKKIFNELILIWWIRFWVVHWALVMGYNIGAVTIFVHRLWTKLWQAKSDFLQSEMQ